MRNIFIFLILLFAGINANAQLVVDITTGKDNTTGTQIPCGNLDDSWEMNTTSGYVWPIVTDGVSATTYQQVYALPYNNCGKWISATANTSCLLPYMPQQASFHEFKLTFFNNAGCNLTNARFEFDAIAVDDAIYFEFNNNLVQYHVNTTLSNCVPTAVSVNYSALTTSITVPINPAHIVPGLNELRAYVCNGDRNASFYICGRLKADYLPDPNLIPSISAPQVFCSGSPMTVVGSSASTNVTWHYWEMVQSDALGNITPGGYNWSGFFSGTPGSFTFPAGAPCGKFYKLKLALNNPCTAWSETSVIVSLVCSPTVAITGPSQVCYGQATYCVPNPRPRTVYTWSNGATGSCATYTITNSTTVTVTASNSSGCTASASLPVTMLNTNSDFTLTSTLYPGYYTCSSTPVVTTGLPAGFGFAWIVEEVGPPPTYTPVPNTLVNNPSCWWTMNTNFTGYNGTSTYPSTCPAGNPPGQFTAGKYYRITRCTWSASCPWQQTSKLVFMCNNCYSLNSIIVIDDPNAPSYENMVPQIAGDQSQNNFMVVPNPSSGSFSIQLDNTVQSGSVEIFNLLGEQVDGFPISETKTVTVSTELTRGVYLVRINSETGVMSQRIVIE